MTRKTSRKAAKPYFNVFAEKLGEQKEDDRLIRIGAAFHHKKGDGFNVVIESLPLSFNGKLVILPPLEDED